MNTETVKGFKDSTGKEAEKKAFLKGIVEEVFRKYNFEPAETPIIEYEDFVKGENTGDQAISDIFRLKDKGDRQLALRYEFTFQLKRIAKNKKLPYKRYQIGPVFRDEPIQGNRLRQFTQCDIDTIGSIIKDEAEILATIKEIMDNVGVNPVIFVNNRKLLDEILDQLGVKEKKEALREIDKLDKLSEEEIKKNLKKYGAEKLLEIVKQKPSFFKKYKAYKEIEELQEYCKYYGVDTTFSSSLARGLSYYNGSVFEVKSDIKETICGGGSYMVDGVQATGISLGLERLEAIAKVDPDFEKLLIVSINEDKKAIQIAQQIRKKGKDITILYGKPSKALDYANAYGLEEVVFIGKKELEEKKLKVRNMKTGEEKDLEIRIEWEEVK